MRLIIRGLLLMVLTAALSAVGVQTALAQTPTPDPEYQGLTGTIKSVSPSGGFVLSKKQGGDVTVNLNPQTKYKAPGAKDATLASFKVGDRVAVLVKPGNVALHVHLIPGKPSMQHRVGTVEKYEVGKSINVKDKKGGLSTFVVTKDTKIKFQRGATEVKVGSRATVVARREPATDQFIAREIHVLGAKGSPPGSKPEGAGKPEDKGQPKEKGKTKDKGKSQGR